MVELIATCWTHSGTSYPLPGHDVSDLTLRDRAEAAAAEGYSGIGVVLGDLRVALRTASLRDLRLMFDDLGLRHVELEFLTDWWETGEKRSTSDAERRELLEAAEVLNARHIKIGATVIKDGGKVPDFDITRLAAPLRVLAEEASGTGTKLALEFLPMSDVATVRQAIELVESVGHPAAGLCVDIWHVIRGGSPVTDVAAIPRERVVAVEINDAPEAINGPIYLDTIHHRVFPGLGDFPVAEFVAAVKSTGFDGPWGVEVLSDIERKRPIRAILADAREATLPLLEQP